MKKQASIIQITFSLIFIVASTFGLVIGVKPSSQFNKVIKVETTTNSLSNPTILKLKFLYQKYVKQKTVNNLVNLINFAIKNKITDNPKLKNFNFMLNKFLATIVRSGLRYQYIDSLYKNYDKEQNGGDLSYLLSQGNRYNPSDNTKIGHNIRLINQHLRFLFMQRTDLDGKKGFHDENLSKPKPNLNIRVLIKLLRTPTQVSWCLTGVKRDHNFDLIHFIQYQLKWELTKIKTTVLNRLKLSQKHNRYTNKSTISNLKKILRFSQKNTQLNSISMKGLGDFFQNDLKTFNKLIGETINK